MPPKEKTQVYMGGDDPGIVEKRAAYEQALERLSNSLEARKQQFFDPALLNVAKAFLTPTKTGSFFESLAPAAEGYARGQQESADLEEKIARAQMEAAAAGLDIERQKQADAQLARYLGGQPSGQPSAPPSEPTGGLPDRASGVGEYLPKPGPLSQMGIQVMPPRQDRMTGRQFIEMNRGTMPPRELLKQAQEIDQKNVKATDAYIFDEAAGVLYPTPGADLKKRNLRGAGPGGETIGVEVSPRQAFLLDLYEANDDPRYYDLARQIARGPKTQGPEPEPIKGIAESAAAAEAAKVRAVKREEIAAKYEENAPQIAQSARGMKFAASNTEQIVSKRPEIFGILKQPYILNTIANVVSQGLKVKDGTISIPQLDEAVVQITGKKGDLATRKLVTRNIAQTQLEFRRLYFSGYGGGAISDMEQRKADQLSAAIEDDPAAILAISKLIKTRAQFDIDNYKNWLEFKKSNKGANYSDYMESEPYLARLDKFENNLASMFGAEPAVPSEPRKSQAPRKQSGKSEFTPEQIENARARLRKLKGE